MARIFLDLEGAEWSVCLLTGASKEVDLVSLEYSGKYINKPIIHEKTNSYSNSIVKIYRNTVFDLSYCGPVDDLEPKIKSILPDAKLGSTFEVEYMNATINAKITKLIRKTIRFYEIEVIYSSKLEKGKRFRIPSEQFGNIPFPRMIVLHRNHEDVGKTMYFPNNNVFAQIILVSDPDINNTLLVMGKYHGKYYLAQANPAQ